MMDIRDMEKRVTPLIEETKAILDNNKTEQAQMREIIVRYDEVISGKASKNAHETLSNELHKNYVKEETVQEIEADLNYKLKRVDLKLNEMNQKFVD